MDLVGRQLVQQALDAGERDNITVVLIEITALDAETLPDDPPSVPPVPELTQTRRFEVSPEKIAAQREALRKKQRQELRREIWMIVLVTLAVLVLVGGILFVSLYRPFRHATPPNGAQKPAASAVPVQTMEPVTPVQTVEPVSEIEVSVDLPSSDLPPEAKEEIQQSIANMQTPNIRDIMNRNAPETGR